MGEQKDDSRKIELTTERRGRNHREQGGKGRGAEGQDRKVQRGT